MFRKPKKRPKASLLSKKRKSNGINPNSSTQSTGEDEINYKKQNTGRKKSLSDDATSSDDESTLNDSRRQYRKTSNFSVKEKKKSRVLHQFESADPSKQLSAKDMATREAEFHPQQQAATINQKDSSRKSNLDVCYPCPDNNDDTAKLYKGQKETRNKFLAGPLRAPNFVRTTSRFDYQPDICKDYKETGFCGFGDTCIYLHDRGDTLTGWQLEAEWEERKKKEREKKEKEMENFAKGENQDENNIMDGASVESDGLPFACHLCREAFKDPVVTKCGHYFCKGCIIQQVRSNSGGTTECPICKKDTLGVFNNPIKLISKKRKLLNSKATWEEFAEIIRKTK